MKKEKKVEHDLQISKIEYDEQDPKKHQLPVNGEFFLRMQFMLQAASLLSNQGEEMMVQKHLVGEVKNITKKKVLRMDPTIKQRYCKRCNSQFTGGMIKGK